MSKLARYRSSLGRLHPDMAQFVSDVDTSLAQLQASSGQSLDPPTQALFTVTGVDGKFVIAITAPENILPYTANQALIQSQMGTNQQGIALLHQVQSATDINFNNASSIADYGVSSQLSYTFQLPNQTLFWRLRSSYDGVNWNDWQIYSTAAQCGPVSVWSGLLRNSASAIVDSATTPQGNSPLTQSGITKTINIAATTWNDGDQVIAYNPGSVTPAAYGQWLIYALDQFRAGGTVTFLATQASSDITASLYSVYFGAITTSAGGGGTGSGGGGGTCCRAGVPYLKFDGTYADCSALRVGDVVMGVDMGPEVIQQIDVIPKRPCFRLVFDSTGKLTTKLYIGDFTVYRLHLDRSHTFFAGAGGIIDGASSEHIIQYAGGGFEKVFEAVVGETFSLVKGAVGSHNVRKFN
jgi:hypothetical protein